jgi:hypothetical protein
MVSVSGCSTKGPAEGTGCAKRNQDGSSIIFSITTDQINLKFKIRLTGPWGRKWVWSVKLSKWSLWSLILGKLMKKQLLLHTAPPHFFTLYHIAQIFSIYFVKT